MWHYNLDVDETKEWNKLKPLFLKRFQKLVTAVERVQIFTELSQKGKESCKDFADRVKFTISRLDET